MSASDVSKQLLKNMNEEYYRTNKINSTTRTTVDTYIDSINNRNFYEVSYAEFDQVASDAEIVFDDSARTATNGEGVDKSIVTEALALTQITIRSLMVKGSTTQDVQFYLSIDGTNFYAVDSFNLNEVITADSIYIKVSTPDNVVSGIIVVYENN